MKSLVIIAHMPSENTRRLAEAVRDGAQSDEIAGVTSRLISPFEADAADVLNADAVILGTTENLGYMSGALKDFFDRIYYPCLEQKQGLSVAAYIRAGHDGTATQRALESIITGLQWRWVQPILLCRGEWDPAFIEQCETLGATVAAGLGTGLYG